MAVNGIGIIRVDHVGVAPAWDSMTSPHMESPGYPPLPAHMYANSNFLFLLAAWMCTTTLVAASRFSLHMSELTTWLSPPSCCLHQWLDTLAESSRHPWSMVLEATAVGCGPLPMD